MMLLRDRDAGEGLLDSAGGQRVEYSNAVLFKARGETDLSRCEQPSGTTQQSTHTHACFM